jgi:hypothetical protein
MLVVRKDMGEGERAENNDMKLSTLDQNASTLETSWRRSRSGRRIQNFTVKSVLHTRTSACNHVSYHRWSTRTSIRHHNFQRLRQHRFSMKVLGLLSGGKDSCYNLMHCIANGHEVVALATLVPEEGVGKQRIPSSSDRWLIPYPNQMSWTRTSTNLSVHLSSPSSRKQCVYHCIERQSRENQYILKARMEAGRKSGLLRVRRRRESVMESREMRRKIWTSCFMRSRYEVFSRALVGSADLELRQISPISKASLQEPFSRPINAHESSTSLLVRHWA